MGIAVLDSEVFLATSKTGKLTTAEAYWAQYDAARKAISMYEPDKVVMEGPAYGSRYNMEQLAVVRGLIEMIAAPMEVTRYSPSALKKFVTGNGKASKTEVFSAVCNKAAAKNWSLPANSDEADALGLLLMAMGDQ